MSANTPETTAAETEGMQDLYFDLQAEVDMTKHIGSLDTTHKLLELVHIDGPKHVLDVGCGVGRTPAYLAKKYGCTVVGIDIRDKMIARSKERAKREGLEDLLEFHVADAQDLPFDDARFDVVMTESVVVMIPDQQKALGEFVRVVKPGGYVGLNEATWQKDPTPDMEQYLRRIWGAEMSMHDAAGYRALLETAGLRDIVAQVHAISVTSETRSRFKRIGYGNTLRMWGKALSMLRSRPDYRDFLKTAFSTPKEIVGYWAAGLYVGRK